MKEYINKIEKIWQIRNELSENNSNLKEARELTGNIIHELDRGNLRVCEKQENHWLVNEWIKKAILLHFQITESQIYNGECIRWYDKINPKYNNNFSKEKFKKDGVRIVPGAFIRTGAYLAPKVITMPSFINIGAYIGEGTMIDSFATVGSCAQIGKHCHISGGAGIGGVLEPLGARPVIIEDGCFIGARSEIVEGVIVEEGAVVSMGVFIGASTKIVDRYTGEITYGKVPAYSVVVPGTLPAKESHLPSLYCAVIIKKVDKVTRSKTSINELLR